MITVVGGVYAERCVEPHWDDVYGSAGRAAAAISGSVETVRLITYRATDIADGLDSLQSAYGLAIEGPQVAQGIGFDYMHSLADPRISPRPDAIFQNDPLEVTDDIVLRFGMLEGTAKVTAGRAIYDPQSAFDPRPFEENGSQAEHLALILNRLEASRFTNNPDPEKAVDTLLADGKAEVVILKMGGRGALVATKDGRQMIPAYKSESVWKIGSGDVFSAAFALYWGVQQREAIEAAHLASRATSYYCGTRALPIPSADGLLQLNSEPVSPSSGRIYLAAPFFNLAERWIVEEVRNQLLHMGVDVFSPIHDVGIGSAQEVAKRDLAGLGDCKAVLAILNGGDAGTIFEVGYAVAKGIPVVALAQNMRPEDVKMPEGTGCLIVGDMVSAVYHAVWALR